MYSTYKKIETFADVPKAGPLDAQVRETPQLDFKETSAPDKTAEHAKDMATFANGFGGVILVGSKVTDGIVEHTGIARAHAARMAEVYEQAAKDLCSPSPIVNAIIVAMPGSTSVLLAVNVDPIIEGPVGAKQGEAWLFPMREGSHTKYLKPIDLPMYLTPGLRRVLLLLDRIKENASVQVWVQPQAQFGAASSALDLTPHTAHKGSVDLAKNVIILKMAFIASVHIPLTEVKDVWQDANEMWNIRLGGRINPLVNSRSTMMFQPVSG